MRGGGEGIKGRLGVYIFFFFFFIAIFCGGRSGLFRVICNKKKKSLFFSPTFL